MVNFITLDFETKSSVPIERGAELYIKEAEPLCFSFKDQGKDVTTLKDKNRIKTFCKSLIFYLRRGNHVVAHNAAFDFMMFQKLTRCPNDLYKNFIDTSLLSRVFSGPGRLEDCVHFWNLKNKKSYGKDLIEALSVPYTKKSPKVVQGVTLKDHVRADGFVKNERLFNLMVRYCEQDVEVTYELFKKLIPYFLDNEYIIEKIRKSDYINFLRNREGIRFDLGLVDTLRETENKLGEVYQRRAKALTNNPDFNLNSSVQFMKYIKENGYKDVKSTRSSELNNLKNNLPKNSNLKQLIDLRLNRPSGKTKNFEKILEHSKECRIFNSVQFYGASTGRYTGF